SLHGALPICRSAVLRVPGDPAGRRLARRAARFPHRPRLARPRRDGALPAGGADRRRGPELRHPFGLRLRGHPPGARTQRAGRPAARRQHHQPAGGQEPVPLARVWRRLALGAQGPGGLVHRVAGTAVAQAPDPGGLRQRGRVRRRRVRRAGRGAPLLRPRRVGADPHPVCAPGRGAPQPAALQRHPAGALRPAPYRGDRAQHAPDRRHRLRRGAGLRPAATPAWRETEYDAAMSREVLTVVVAARDEAEALPLVHARVAGVLGGLREEGVDGRILYGDDGSSDGTWEVMRGLASGDRRVSLLRLSRNFGKEAALTAGLDHVAEGAAVLLDADGQDPPELIPRFVEKWREGYDDVYGMREQRDGEGWFKRLTAHLFYRVIQRLSRTPVPTDTGDFRLLSPRALAALAQLRERHRFMKGLFGWIGYNRVAVPYRREPRVAGRSKFSFWKLWNFALEGITSFS